MRRIYLFIIFSILFITGLKAQVENIIVEILGIDMEIEEKMLKTIHINKVGI